MKLTNEQHNILIDWIERYLIPINNINPKINTSHIREAFMQTYKYGFYLDNNALNDAMHESGYCSKNFASEPYLRFNVSNQSPALREYHQWVLNSSTYQKYE